MMTMKPDCSAANLCAIVVSYRPCLETLAKLLAALEGQVAVTLVVDNGSPAAVASWLRGQARSTVVPMLLENNLGVAAAHNRGVGWAREQGYSYIILFDQDSLPAPDMVKQLCLAYQALAAAGKRVAAVGPRYFDKCSDQAAPFVRMGYVINRRVSCTPQVEWVKADFLITSGSLVALAILDRVGGFDEGLFIDNVDMEWCFRAQSQGFELYGICRAVMAHNIGEGDIKLWLPYRFIVHAPFRLYYIMRNRVLLYRRAYTPLRWITQDVLRLLAKLAIFALLVPPRRLNLAMMMKGLRDGVRGETGALRDAD